MPEREVKLFDLILITKAFYFLTNLADFINMHIAIFPDDTLKVWTGLVHPPWEELHFKCRLLTCPPRPPSIPKARFDR